MTVDLSDTDRAVLELAGELVDIMLDPVPRRGARRAPELFRRHLHTYAKKQKITTIQAKEDFRESLNRLRDEMII